jgi:beta-N-acetylhexosaminidase
VSAGSRREVATTARWQPGQALFAGFAGTTCPRPLLDLIAAGRVGGVVLFARNVESPRQVRALVRELRAHEPGDAPLVISIDQEGGRVQRLRTPWTEWPPMRRLGALPDALETTAAVARALATELRDCGIGLDFAPVVDVDSNPANPVIGDRSFASDPARVAAHARAFIGAMQSAGVACCAKHFPGHGDTTLDSHLALPRIAHGLDRLLAVELPPFAAAIDAGVASIMSAHVVFEAIDPHRPATFSPDVLGLLRERLGYDGLVFSDDLEMRAVADHWRPHEMVDLALGAGVDVLLACERFALVTELLARLEALPDARVEQALSRVAAFKRRFALPRPGPPGPPGERAGPPYPDHVALAARIAGNG